MKTKIISAIILILIIASILYLKKPISSSANVHIFLLSQTQGVMISDDGTSWDDFSKGLPGKIAPVQLYAVKKQDTYALYLTTAKSGLFKREFDQDKQWTNITSPDFKVRSQFQDNPGYRKISAFAIDPLNNRRLVLATKHTIYISEDEGASWKRAPVEGFGNRNYITAIAMKGNTIAVGTSFNSIYISHGHGFKRQGLGLPKEPYSGDNYFTEEITTIAFDPINNTIYAGTAFGKGAFYSLNNGVFFNTMLVPIDKKSLKDVCLITPHETGLFVNGEERVYIRPKSTNGWQSIQYSSYVKKVKASLFPKAALVIDKTEPYPPLYFTLPQQDKKLSGPAANKRSLYVPVHIANRQLPSIISSLKKTGFNAVVIDMKDDFGNLYFPTQNEVAKKIYSIRRPVAIKKILQELKNNGIYSIARIVTFKDQKMYHGFGYKYAIKNLRTGGAWKGSRHEYWVDPHADVVQQYNIDIAKELQDIGFDEIQFDYIRFPSDGPIYLCAFAHRKDNDMYKSEILGDFLARAKSQIRIPISVDIYGFNSWYHFGNWIGQDMEAFSHIVDAISPMVYPSHFGPKWYMNGKRALRPYRIVYDGGKRGVKLVDNRVPLRPYIQAFRMLSPTWGPDYIKYQAQGADDSGCSGYIYWNARGDYSMVEQAFGKK